MLAGEEATRYLSFLVVRDVEFRRGVVRRLRLISADSTWVVLKGRWSQSPNVLCKKLGI